jgi:hypothetical protein
MRAPERFIATHAIPLLAAFGLLLLAVGIFDPAPPEAVRTALVVVGAGAVILALLRYHLEGEVEVGPAGLKANLRDTVADQVESTLAESPPPPPARSDDELLGEEQERAAGSQAVWRRRVADRVAQQLFGD